MGRRRRLRRERDRRLKAKARLADKAEAPTEEGIHEEESLGFRKSSLAAVTSAPKRLPAFSGRPCGIP